ncbi:MAG: hypothetical protein P4L22_06805 [Candidatus Babeliales bacterium]|nr:hypothetical protein [Candidatus Babeliales bacterium]
MKTKTKLVLGLLLATGYVSANCDTKVKAAVPIETIYRGKVAAIAENKKFKFGTKALEKLTVEEKEDVLMAIIENLFDENHKDNFEFHVDFITYLFDKNKTTIKYKELAEYLKKNKECSSATTFFFMILPQLKSKAPEKVTNKVKAIVATKKYKEMWDVISSKLKQ